MYSNKMFHFAKFYNNSVNDFLFRVGKKSNCIPKGSYTRGCRGEGGRGVVGERGVAGDKCTIRNLPEITFHDFTMTLLHIQYSKSSGSF